MANSAVVHEMAFRDVMAQWRTDLLSSFVYSDQLGRPTREVFASLGVKNPEECARLTRLKQESYMERLSLGALGLFPGASALLRRLRRLGRECFLVTGGSLASIGHALRITGVEELFTGIITADDVACGKPDPECLQLCLARYGLSPESCVVVEDAASGIAAARAMRLSVIGVHNPDIRELADAWFPTLTAMLAELRERL